MASSKETLADLSQRHAVVLLGGKALISYWEPSPLDPTKVTPAFAAPAAMSTLYRNLYVSVTQGETTVRKPAFGVWMGMHDRPTAMGVAVDPGEGRFTHGALNLWRGYDVEPRKGDWHLLHEHVREVICDGDEASFRYLLRWMAWKLQNPTGRPEVAVVMVGNKGVGKGTTVDVLLKIFGFHALHISSRKHLVGNFNKHLMNCLFVNPDEAVWGGDREGEGNLKRLITEASMFVEPKGIDGFEMPNMLAFMMTANPGWTVPASDDERRYAVFGVSDKRRGDTAYFKALRHEIQNGGTEAFLHDMLAMALGDWHPREDVPVTKALGQQQGLSADKLVHWMGDILTEGALPYSVRDPATGQVERLVHPKRPELARAQLLLQHAQLSGSRHLTGPEFRAAMEKYGTVFGQERDKYGRYTRFPPLPEMRKRFRELHAWWPAFDGEGDQWVFPDQHYRPNDFNLYQEREEDEPHAG